MVFLGKDVPTWRTASDKPSDQRGWLPALFGVDGPTTAADWKNAGTCLPAITAVDPCSSGLCVKFGKRLRP